MHAGVYLLAMYPAYCGRRCRTEWICGAAFDRGPTGVGSTQNSSCELRAHLWWGPMGGCTDIPETDFRALLSASLLPPCSPSLGTELARLELRLRSEWSSLRLLRILPCGSLMLLLRQSRLITFWDTASSKRCRCFLGINILANMVSCEEKKRNNINSGPQLKKSGGKHHRGTSSPQERSLEFQFNHIWSNSDIQHKKVMINWMESSKWRVILINRLPPSRRQELKAKGMKKVFDREVVFLLSSQRWRKRERLDLSRRRGNVGVTLCLLGSHCCSVRYHRQNTARGRKKEVWEWASMGFLSLCLHHNHLILALSLLHFRPRFSSVSLSIGAQSREMMTSVTNLHDKSSQLIFHMIKYRLLVV